MLVRLNGKSVYRSFFSLSHVHSFSPSLPRFVPMSSSTLFRCCIFFSFFATSLLSTIHVKMIDKRYQDCLFLFLSDAVIHRNASVDKMCSRDKLDHRKIAKKLCICEFQYQFVKRTKNVRQYVIKKKESV